MTLEKLVPARLRPILGLAALFLLPFASGLAGTADASDLRLVVILTRHGVRSPLLSNEKLDALSAQPWPRWPVPPGTLTAHGDQQMHLMANYYRAFYVNEGLLTGRTSDDLPRILFRADNDQRTIATAQALAAGLVPGAHPPVDARPAGEIDPMFRPLQVPIGRADKALGVSALLGRIGGDPARVEEACRPALLALRQVLYGGDGTPPAGKGSLLLTPTTVHEGTRDHTVEFSGQLGVAFSLIDALLLEYAEGMPMQDVGWGRMTPEVLTQLLLLHSVEFNLTSGTFYAAQIQGSNLGDHILRTIEQAATGQAQPGAFGTPEHRMVVLVGHDTNILNVGGMLGLNWWLPGTQLNPILPGGALVFELRRHRADGRFFVRTFYLSQTLAQTRNLDPLTLDHPPALAPIFVPGCSEAGPGFDAPLDRFKAVLQRAIDPAFVLPGSS